MSRKQAYFLCALAAVLTGFICEDHPAATLVILLVDFGVWLCIHSTEDFHD